MSISNEWTNLKKKNVVNLLCARPLSKVVIFCIDWCFHWYDTGKIKRSLAFAFFLQKKIPTLWFWTCLVDAEIVSIENNNEGEQEDSDLPLYDLATIVHATNDFSNDTKLGQGGFGPVYKVCVFVPH